MFSFLKSEWQLFRIENSWCTFLYTHFLTISFYLFIFWVFIWEICLEFCFLLFFFFWVCMFLATPSSLTFSVFLLPFQLYCGSTFFDFICLALWDSGTVHKSTSSDWHSSQLFSFPPDIFPFSLSSLWNCYSLDVAYIAFFIKLFFIKIIFLLTLLWTRVISVLFYFMFCCWNVLLYSLNSSFLFVLIL